MLTKKTTLPLGHMLAFGWMPSPLKKLLYRRMGYKIGAGVHLGLGSVVAGREVEIGDEAKIGMMTVIRGRKITIGPRVKIGMMTVLDCPKIDVGEGTRINNQVVVGGLATPQSAFRIGRNCILMEWSFVNTSLPVTIGDDVGIGGHCLFFTHGMWPNTFEGFPSKYAPIEIKDQAWLAWRVAVLPGVTIGSRSILSSDACVVKDIPDGALAAGVPAKVIMENEKYVGAPTPDENKKRLSALFDEFIDWLSFHDIAAERRDDARIAVTHANIGCGRSEVIFRYDEEQPAFGDQPANADRCLVSLPALDGPARDQLTAAGVPWIDIASKERSIKTNPIIDECEEYLHRAGLRLLKYSRWR